MTIHKRHIDTEDILVPNGFKIDVVMTHLTTPISLIFSDNGDMYLANAGVATGNGQVLKLTYGGILLIAEGLLPPVTGISYYQDHIYVSHKDKITRVGLDGSKETILSGLPSYGDHHTNQVAFGADGKMYFGQGSATNSGVVGLDNRWSIEHPFFHDYPGQTISLRGMNFLSDNPFTIAENDRAITGAFSPFGVPTDPGETIKGVTKASGSILRANPDGSELEVYAWGLRNPFRIKFDDQQHLFSTNHGMDERGSRPIAQAVDEFHSIHQHTWYGWPDYSGGFPVTHPYFKPKHGPQPHFLLAYHPIQPPKPLATFKPHSAIMGFDFNNDIRYGPKGDVYIAEYGKGDRPHNSISSVGHRISRIHLPTGQITPFAMNKSGFAASLTQSGGFERPIDVVFGPDHAMYIVDMGLQDSTGKFIKQTGVVWRITTT